MTAATDPRPLSVLRLLAARLALWLEREKSEDPTERPMFGLREAHLYPGLVLLALGIGLLAGLGALTVGLPLWGLYGAGAVCVVMGAGLFRLGRKP